MKVKPSPGMRDSAHLSNQADVILKHEQIHVNRILDIVRKNRCCRVLGPRYQGKSRLIRQAAMLLHEGDAHYTVYMNLAQTLSTSEADFFTSLYEQVRGVFAGESVHLPQAFPKTPLEFQHLLIERVRASERNLALFIDHLEAAPPNWVAGLLGSLRSVFNTFVDQMGSQFQAVVCGSLSFSQLVLEGASRFESISKLVFIDDLDLADRYELARRLCQQANLHSTQQGLQSLLEQTGGDRFLIEHVLYVCAAQMRKQGKVRVTAAWIMRSIETLLAEQPPPEIEERLRQIESDPNLLSCTVQILNQGAAPSTALPIASNEGMTSLDLCGVFAKDAEYYRIKSPLWLRLLRQRFTPAHIGGLYAIAGDWRQAITYLGQAVRAGRHEVHSTVLTATIAAMYTSSDVTDCFHYLKTGLETIYPNTDLRVYRRSNNTLFLIAADVNNSEPIHLSDHNTPEAVALRGPEYSVASTAVGTRLLLPLRAGGMENEALGLISLRKPSAQPAEHDERETMLQLSGFLRQAAHTIEVRSQLADLLSATEKRTATLDALNTVLERIFHEWERPEETIWRLMLVGVTAGWALAFNRAILFLPDRGRRALVGRLGVGHLTRAEAEDDWARFPFPNLDALIEHVLQTPAHKTPLQVRIEQIAIPLARTAVDPIVHVYQEREAIWAAASSSLRKLPAYLRYIIQEPNDFAIVPLYTRDDTVGVLYVDNHFSQHPITLDVFKLLQNFVRQAAVAIDNLRMLGAARDREVRERITSLATGLIHEINNALADVPDLVDEIGQNVEQGQAVAAPLQELQEIAQETMEIATRLNDFAIGKLNRAPIAVDQLIKDALKITRDQKPPHITIDYTQRDGLMEVEVDKLWVQLLLKNLILNAYDAIPKERSGIIQIRAERDEAAIHIAVADNGVGISPENYQQIFTYGFTTKVDRQPSLLHGIGLFFGQQIAREHGGSLQVQSTFGVGSTFTLTLPNHVRLS